MSKFSWKNALIAGTAVGVISELVKSGRENIFPSRVLGRNRTNPPQELSEQMDVPAKLAHTTHTYSGRKLSWISHLVHFGFSISFAITYTALLEKKVKWLIVDQGVPFGLAVWVAFHLVIMPLMKAVPSPKDQPLEEHASETPGHIARIWTNNEVVGVVLERLRRDRREHQCPFSSIIKLRGYYLAYALRSNI